MKTLIIAEKPSLAKNIVDAIIPKPKWKAGNHKNSGHYENEDYVVSYAFGHLLKLNDAEDYNEDYKSWDTALLPITPSEFKYKAPSDAGAKHQLTLLKSLIKRADVDKIVNAGDSDREGEIIIRNILNAAKNKKPVYRLWMPDQTPKTIRAELKKMSPDSDYDNLAAEGYARTFIDWLYGINLTRLVTKKAGQLFRVGRVTSPIVTAICEREREIAKFRPKKYYVPTHDTNGLKLSSKHRLDTQKESDEICDKYNKARTVVSELKAEKKTLPRPKLFALSDLQGVVGTAHKFAPKKTLDIVQKLYEAGYVSYPRTDCRYMADNEKSKAKDIIAALKKVGYDNSAYIDFRNDKNIFDSSKVEAHSAITPTYKIPNLSSLTKDERAVYEIIVRRFMAAFWIEDYVIERTSAEIDNGYEVFKLSGDVVISKGYTVIEPVRKQSELPPLKKGDIIDPDFKSAEKETTPPDHYTVDTLNAYLKKPFSQKEKSSVSGDSDTEEALKEIELGTEATRAGLIEAAIHSGYITLISNKYGITSKGELYTDALSELDIDMTKSKTLELGVSMKKIARGAESLEVVVAQAKQDIDDVCRQAMKLEVKAKPVGYGYAYEERRNMMAENLTLCACPKCGKSIKENSKAFSCEDKDCGCVIFKTDRFFERFGKHMTASIAKELFTKKQVHVKGMKSERTGRLFDATVKVDFSGRWPNYQLEFDRK